MKKKSLNYKKALGYLAFYGLLIVIWQSVYFIGTQWLQLWKSYAFPSPAGVFSSFFSLTGDGTLGYALLYSIVRAFSGFALAIAIGLTTGLLLIFSRRCKTYLKPLLLGIQTLPSICWVPFAILWFGLNTSAILFVVVMGSAFSIALSFENGIRNVPPLIIRAAQTMGAQKKNLYLKVIIPASLPSFVSGLRQGWSFAWRALMSGEVMSTTIGLGHTLMMGRDLADINQVMLIMIIIIIIGVFIDKMVFSKIEQNILEKRGL